jgi:ferredoxin
MVLPSEVVEHFIDEASHHVIMNFCICRTSMQCADYPRDLGCLFLGEAALRINPALGRQVTREEARSHVRACRERGLVHLIGRNKLDSVWLKARPDDRLLTVCNCCPCCCLWMMLPHVAPQIAGKVTKMPGVSVRVTDACVGCGACVSSCFVSAISIDRGRARISDACRGCGRCVDACPQGAIEVRWDNRDASLSETVARIERAVDVT